MTSGQAAAADGRYWLIKSEPDEFSFADLMAAPSQTTSWGGVRNYQARNFMRDGMRVGDLVLFYHSNADPAGVAGIAEVVRAAYPDPSAFDPADPYYDPRSRPEAPAWVAVDVRAVRPFARLVPLDAMRAAPALAGMELLRRGSRLSVHPVTRDEFEAVRAMGEGAGSGGAAGGERPEDGGGDPRPAPAARRQ